MHAVIQEDKAGCGLASVSYTELKSLANRFGIAIEDERLYSDTAYLRRLLQRYKISLSGKTRPFVSWVALATTALLAVNL